MSAQSSTGPWAVWQKHKNGVRDRLGRYAVLKDGPGAREVIADNLRTHAYANLVAAAPDLLAACEDALADAQEALMWAESSEIQGLLARCERLQAAIAKATGGAE